MPMLALIGVLFAANAWVGWLLDFHAVRRYVTFWILCALALATAWNIVTVCFLQSAGWMRLSASAS
jgi:hypothetical protein